MHYTLRIIDQSKNQLEVAENYSLGDEYVVRMKTPSKNTGGKNDEHLNFFHEHLVIFLGGEPEVEGKVVFEDWQNIVGLVYGNNKTYAIKDTDVAYIVNSDGKTFERLYGQYQKY